MKLLLDTPLLICAAAGRGLSPRAVALIEDADTDLYFSAASILEVAVKAAERRSGFEVDPSEFRRDLLDAGYRELAITGLHAVWTALLPKIHNDVFDRLLIAQAVIEGISLLTANPRVMAYDGPIESAL